GGCLNTTGHRNHALRGKASEVPNQSSCQPAIGTTQVDEVRVSRSVEHVVWLVAQHSPHKTQASSIQLFLADNLIGVEHARYENEVWAYSADCLSNRSKTPFTSPTPALDFDRSDPRECGAKTGRIMEPGALGQAEDDFEPVPWELSSEAFENALGSALDAI